jgi:hypothetical protein
VTPFCGFVVLPHQCGIVRVVGSTDTPPPIVVVVGSNAEALIGLGLTVGVPDTPVLADADADADVALNSPITEPTSNASNRTLVISLSSGGSSLASNSGARPVSALL